MAYTCYHPTMEYSVKVNGTATETAKGKVSCVDGYNGIAITYKCTNQSINRYQVWVTNTEDYPEEVIHGRDWGREVGSCALDTSLSLAQNTNHTSEITVTKTIFNQGDGLYRLALCARGDLDNTWDVTLLYLTLTTAGGTDTEMFAAADGVMETQDGSETLSALSGTASAGLAVPGTTTA